MPYIVSIIGAGISGPVLALTILSNPYLRDLYTPIIYEKLPEPRVSDGTSVATYAAGAAVALTSNALFPLYELGLKDELHKISSETTRIQIWRAWKGGAHKYYNSIVNPNYKSDLETNMRVVQRKDLQTLLLDRVKELGGEIVWGKKYADYYNAQDEMGYPGRLKIIFEDESQVYTDLIVGADGIWSMVRKHIVGMDGATARDRQVPGWDQKWKPDFAFQEGIYGVSKRVEGTDSNPGDTHWVLLDIGTASTWALPDGKQFWTISLPSSAAPVRSAGGANREYTKNGAEISTGGYSIESTEAILKSFEDIWHPVLGTFGEVFKSSERIVRTSLWHHAWWGYQTGNHEGLVVIGDASRVMLPTSGQGACFGIEDATVLANALLNHPPESAGRRGVTFEKAIEKYQRLRRERSDKMTKQSYWTAVVTLGEWWWWRWLRDFAMAWLPMSADPKAPKKGPAKDPMGWLHDVRYKVVLAPDIE